MKREELIDKFGETDYKWLLKNDKDYVDEKTKHIKRHKPTNQLNQTQSNWGNRDLTLLEKLKIIVNNIITDDSKPVKIIQSRIIQYLDIKEQMIFLQNKRRLPQSASYINMSVEDDEKFVFRRINWARRKYLLNNNNITKDGFIILSDISRYMHILVVSQYIDTIFHDLTKINRY